MTHTPLIKRACGAPKFFGVVPLGVAMATLGGSAQAQYDGAYGRDFSNPIAATLSIRMQHLAHMDGLGKSARGTSRPTLQYRYTKAIALGSIGPDVVTRGKRVIAAGKATTTFKGVGYYVVREYEFQNQKYESSLKNRGLSPVDLADVVSFAIVKSLEFCGQESASSLGADSPQYKAIKARARDRLLQDPRVQGLSEYQKNALAETIGYELSSTWNSYNAGQLLSDNSLMGQIQGRSAHLCEVWLGLRPENITLTATGVMFKGTAKPAVTQNEAHSHVMGAVKIDDFVADTSTESSAQTAISFEEAKRFTSFKNTGTLLVPALLVKGMQGSAQERAKTQKLLVQMLTTVRANLKDNADSNLPVDNVARAQVYAISQLYPLLMTPKGQPLNLDMPDFTSENVDAMRRQSALALGEDSGFRGLSDRQKQEAYETYLLVPTLAAGLYKVALQSGSEEGQKMARDLAQETLKQMLGAQASQLHFSQTGLSIE